MEKQKYVMGDMVKTTKDNCGISAGIPGIVMYSYQDLHGEFSKHMYCLMNVINV